MKLGFSSPSLCLTLIVLALSFGLALASESISATNSSTSPITVAVLACARTESCGKAAHEWQECWRLWNNGTDSQIEVLTPATGPGSNEADSPVRSCLCENGYTNPSYPTWSHDLYVCTACIDIALGNNGIGFPGQVFALTGVPFEPGTPSGFCPGNITYRELISQARALQLSENFPLILPDAIVNGSWSLDGFKASSPASSTADLGCGGAPPSSSPLKTSATPTSTASSTLVCNQDNCFRQAIQSSAPVSSFCARYTTTVNTVSTGLPEIVAQCTSDPLAVSSACSCLANYKPAPTIQARKMCNEDNCYRQAIKNYGPVTSFCSTYTSTAITNTDFFPLFVTECNSDIRKISSACSCLDDHKSSIQTVQVRENCNRDNCYRQAIRNSGSVTSFCSTYTSAMVTSTDFFPQFLSQCSSDTGRISSVCSCLAGNTQTATTTSGHASSSASSHRVPVSVLSAQTTGVVVVSLYPTTNVISPSPYPTESAVGGDTSLIPTTISLSTGSSIHLSILPPIDTLNSKVSSTEVAFGTRLSSSLTNQISPPCPTSTNEEHTIFTTTFIVITETLPKSVTDTSTRASSISSGDKVTTFTTTYIIVTETVPKLSTSSKSLLVSSGKSSVSSTKSASPSTTKSTSTLQVLASSTKSALPSSSAIAKSAPPVTKTLPLVSSTSSTSAITQASKSAAQNCLAESSCATAQSIYNNCTSLGAAQNNTATWDCLCKTNVGVYNYNMQDCLACIQQTLASQATSLALYDPSTLIDTVLTVYFNGIYCKAYDDTFDLNTTTNFLVNEGRDLTFGFKSPVLLYNLTLLAETLSDTVPVIPIHFTAPKATATQTPPTASPPSQNGTWASLPASPEILGCLETADCTTAQFIFNYCTSLESKGDDYPWVCFCVSNFASFNTTLTACTTCIYPTLPLSNITPGFPRNDFPALVNQAWQEEYCQYPNETTTANIVPLRNLFALGNNLAYFYESSVLLFNLTVVTEPLGLVNV